MSVYFAQVGDYIKIGYSTNPERRVRRLFSSATRHGAPVDAPRDLAARRLIRSIDGDTGTEALIHRALDDFAVGNEWFLDELEVREFITTATKQAAYPKVTRPAGPHDWEVPLTAEEEAQLNAAFAGMYASRT